jgi:hypothetical protein
VTKHPHLKDRVRARMARTGESYMTARRQVIGEDRATTTTAGPAALAPTRWRHLPGIHPQTTVVRTLLANAGLEVSEALALGLSGGIQLNVYESRYEAEDYASLYLTPRPLSDDLAFVTEPLALAGGSVVVDQPGTRGAEAALRRALETGPVAVWLDLAEAGYAALPTPFSGGAYHVASVLHHDGREAVLGDVADAPIRIEAARLTAARARIKRYKARTATLAGGGMAAVPHELLIERALEATAAALDAEGRQGGVRALDRLQAAMGDRDPARAWSVRFRPGPNLARALSGMYRFIEAWGTGGGFLRPLFADFLDEAAAATGRAGVRDVATAYRHAGEAWTELAEAATPDEVPPLAAFRAVEEARADARALGAIPPAQGAALADGVVAAERDAAQWLVDHPAQSAELVARVADYVGEVADRERAAHVALRGALTGRRAPSRGRAKDPA